MLRLLCRYYITELGFFVLRSATVTVVRVCVSERVCVVLGYRHRVIHPNKSSLRPLCNDTAGFPFAVLGGFRKKRAAERRNFAKIAVKFVN